MVDCKFRRTSSTEVTEKYSRFIRSQSRYGENKIIISLYSTQQIHTYGKTFTNCYCGSRSVKFHHFFPLCTSSSPRRKTVHLFIDETNYVFMCYASTVKKALLSRFASAGNKQHVCRLFQMARD